MVDVCWSLFISYLIITAKKTTQKNILRIDFGPSFKCRFVSLEGAVSLLKAILGLHRQLVVTVLHVPSNTPVQSQMEQISNVLLITRQSSPLGLCLIYNCSFFCCSSNNGTQITSILLNITETLLHTFEGDNLGIWRSLFLSSQTGQLCSLTGQHSTLSEVFDRVIVEAVTSFCQSSLAGVLGKGPLDWFWTFFQ